MQLRTLLVPGAAVLLAALATPSFADSTFSASARLREEYNDNLFLTHSGQVQDFITTLNPSFIYTLDRSRLKLAADYNLNLQIFADNPNARTKLLQKARVDSTAELLPGALYLKVIDAFQRIPVDERKPVALGNFLVNQTDSNNFQVGPYWDLPQLGTLSGRLSYIYQNIWYDAPSGDSAENQTASARITKAFSADCVGFVTYSYYWHRPTRSDRYDKQDVAAGLTWQASPKVTLSGTGGRTFFSYQGTDKRTQANVWQVQGSYLLSDSFTVGATYSESYSDSITFGTFRNDGADLSISYDGKLHLKLSGLYSESTYTEIDRKDTSYAAVVDASLPVTPLVNARLTGDYHYLRFRPGTEVVNRYSIRPALEYQGKLARFSVGYTLNVNDSNLTLNNYRNNIVFAEASITY